MKLKEYIKKFISDNLIIFAIIVICITILRQIFAPDEYFELKDIFNYMICSFVGNLPSIILYSSKELSEKELRLRIIIHFVVLEVVLLSFTNVFGFISGIKETILFAFQIAVIYVLVRFLSWMDDRKSADKINEKLKTLKSDSWEDLD
ncbi:DUF3021 domain-containing protein [Oceanirhabdus sp. W0125-5]|uniref:DUF3021 domain-containing protein n=1 Tax=Oceanirhabdus sp. W0125-5 TaxID=2999116 RepID=UPI0022F2F52E|nr:DUF3021 domain-containing protein [Oceanirhabdus sp. W0125-5]WBW95841.1 DUF3021 domain-containing protein [Oceanirhabdus sp. W0125-5]